MAQSTLSTQYLELERTIGRHVFANTDPSSGDQQTVVDDILRRGLRKFYTPPPLDGENYVHVWSFLKKKATISAFTDLTGTATTDPWGTTAIVDSTASFQNGVNSDGADLVGQTVTLTDVSETTDYTATISTVSNGTTLVTTPVWSSTPTASTTDTYKIAVDGDYELPDDFGAIIGDLTYETATAFPPIKVVGETKIRQLRQDSGMNRLDRPRVAAIRAKSQQTAATPDKGTRWELMLWPIPTSTYTLEYQYWVALDELTVGASGLNFPAGASVHSEAILASCMWVAQEFSDPQNRQFDMRTRFMEALKASVMFDRQLHGGEYGAYNSDNSDAQGRGTLWRDRVKNVTVGGVEYP